MNVLMLTTHFNIGGITTYILTVSRYLVRMGCRVTVVSSGGQMVDRLKAQGVDHITVNIRTKSFLSPKVLLALPRLRKIIIEKQIHVIHAHTRVTQVMACVLSKFTSCVYVSTCHGFYRRKLGRRIFPCWGDGIIAISSTVRDHAVNDHRVAQEKVHTVRNGVDIEQFMPVSEHEKQVLRREFGLTSGKLVGMVSRLCAVKGQHIAVEAMAMIVRAVPDAHLVLIGSGRFEKELREMVERIGLVLSVHFFDRIAQSGKVFPVFDCYLMPSLEEGLGLALMEAQASGLPVVASRVGGMVDLIDDGRTGLFVEPNDPKQLADAVVRILTDPEFARALGIRAREFIEREGSADEMTKKIADIYQQLTGRRI